MILKMARACKNALLPGGKHFRRLRFGLAAGCTMLIDFHRNFAMYLGLYERELTPHFRNLLQKGYRCFDVGGQTGYDALMMANLTGGGAVASFECDADAAAQMRKTFARNAFAIETIEAFVDNQNDAQHITLDEAASRTFVPDFIKMDIEGAEYEALLGAKTILATRKPSRL